MLLECLGLTSPFLQNLPLQRGGFPGLRALRRLRAVTLGICFGRYLKQGRELHRGLVTKRGAKYERVCVCTAVWELEAAVPVSFPRRPGPLAALPSLVRAFVAMRSHRWVRARVPLTLVKGHVLSPAV